MRCGGRGGAHQLCKLTLGISNKAKTTMSDKTVHYRPAKTPIPWLKRQIRFLRMKPLFGNSEPLIDFNIITKQADRQIHISEAYGKNMKLSAN